MQTTTITNSLLGAHGTQIMLPHDGQFEPELQRAPQNRNLVANPSVAEADLVKKAVLKIATEQILPTVVVQSFGDEQLLAETMDKETPILQAPATLPLATLIKMGVPGALKELPENQTALLSKLFSGKPGAAQNPTELTELNETIRGYNTQVARLSTELTALKELEDLYTTSAQVAQRIADVNSTLTALLSKSNSIIQKQQQLARNVQQQENNFKLNENQQAAFDQLQANLPDIAIQGAQLRQTLNTIVDIERDSRSQWRTDIAALKQVVAEKLPTLSNKMTASDFVWFYQLQHEAAQPNKDIAKALEKLMCDGAAFPSKLEVTLALLAEFFPQPGVTITNELPTAEQLIEDQPTSISKESPAFTAYQCLISEHNKLNKLSADTFHYLNILSEASTRAINKLPAQIKEQQNSGAYKNAKSQQDQVIAGLRQYYELANCDINQKLSPEKLRLYEAAIRKHKNEEVKNALIAFLEQAQQYEKDAGNVDETDWYSGHLYLLAGAKSGVSKRDVLVLEEKGYNPNELLLHGQTLDQFKTIEETGSKSNLLRLRSHARACLQAEQRLNYHAYGQDLSNSPAHGFGTKVNFSAASKSLFKEFNDSPKEYRAFLTERSERLTEYTDKLAQLLAEIPTENTQELVQPLQVALTRAQAERQILNSLAGISKEFTSLALSEQALASQQIQQTVIDKAIATARKPFDKELAQLNLDIYQLRAQLLQDNNTQTKEITQQQRTLTEEINSLEEQLTAEFGFDLDAGEFATQLEALLQDEPVFQSHPLLTKYDELKTQQQYNDSVLQQLSTEFRIGMLTLQQEELRAKETGGYPENVTWAAWLQSKAPAANWWSSTYRQPPQELLLTRQLALHGIDMQGAYAELASAVTGVTTASAAETLTKLGFTPNQLQAWTSAYPEEARLLAGNLNHAYNILTSSSQELGMQLTDMFTTAWKRGSTENLAEDILLGNRADIVGVVDPKPMPPAMIALLNMAGWAPYVIGAGKAITGGSVAGSVGNLLAGPFGLTGGALTAVKGLLGAAQIGIEVQFAREVNKHRDAEIMINALLGNNPELAGVTITERVKAAAQYTMQRQAMRELGNIARDTFEAGKIGAIQRYREEVSLWWQQSTTQGKVALIATAAGSTLTMGATVAGAALTIIGTGGAALVIAAVLALLAMGSGALLTRSVWSFFAPVLGLTKTRENVQAQMNKNRLDGALKEVRAKLGVQLQKHSIGFSSAKLKQQGVDKSSQFDQGVLRNIATDDIQTQLGQRMVSILEKEPNLSDKALIKRMKIELNSLSQEMLNVTGMLAQSRQTWIATAQKGNPSLDQNKLDALAAEVDKEIVELVAVTVQAA